MKLSVIIITLNEELNIERAIKSAQFADEIVVIDSFSEDKTVKLAKSLGAKVISHKFLGYGQQKNLALTHTQYPWIFWLDADEEISEELKASMLKKLNDPNSLDLYFVNRRTKFINKWIYYGGWYPDLVGRLFKKEKCKFSEPEVHEKVLLKNDGKTGDLIGHLNHFSFPSIADQVLTNIKYAKLGSKELLKKRPNGPTLLEVCLRPAFKFFECLILKKGILDGTSGFIIAVNAAHSMFMKYSMAYMKSL